MTKTYDDYLADVRSPGKFEGEQPWIVYFYENSLEGFYNDVWVSLADPVEDEDEDDDSNPFDEGDEPGFYVTVVTVDEDDVAIFPDFTVGEKIAFYERDDGFVCECNVPEDTEC